jgi:hypothetical protein
MSTCTASPRDPDIRLRLQHDLPGLPGAHLLTDEDYYLQDSDAHIACAHCGADDDYVPNVAWYHTSPHDRWPTSSERCPPPPPNP